MACITNWLRHTLLRYRFQQRQSSSKPMAMNKAGSIMLVAAPQDREAWQALQAFQHKLLQAGLTVYHFAYQPDSTLPSPAATEAGVQSITPQELNGLGLPRRWLYHQVSHLPVDIALNLSQPDFFLPHYLVAISSSPFRLGFYSQQYAYLYDFMVEPAMSHSLATGIATFEEYLPMVQKL